ncbi:hypothetical protein [Burkholderia cenocepacia]|uniref:hypothetical protein n=1 Tax=Burkholderia cenocepacia TaxID=95486 RepID=UPI000F5A2531|nr:hypothetical protein [Burkholderia cenocepacia]RQU83926.1 hypothetical protein DF040_33945 [Burkholderia cenocepacia]
MKTRKYASLVVHAAGLAGTLTLLWQVVRFCKGEVGAPIVDQFIGIAGRVFPAVQNGDPSAVASTVVVVFGMLGNVFYYLFGIAAWVVLAVMASRSSEMIARIVAVGFRPYCAEVAAAWAQDARRARIMSERERRIEARRQRDEPRSGRALAAVAFGTLFGFLMVFLSGGGR